MRPWNQTIASSQKFEDETESSLEKAYDDFLDQFETSEGGSIKAGHEEHEEIDEEDIDQERDKVAYDLAFSSCGNGLGSVFALRTFCAIASASSVRLMRE